MNIKHEQVEFGLRLLSRLVEAQERLAKTAENPEIKRLRTVLDAEARNRRRILDEQDQRIEQLEAALRKTKDMIIEQIQMADQPFEYRNNTINRAQVLLSSLRDMEKS